MNLKYKRYRQFARGGLCVLTMTLILFSGIMAAKVRATNDERREIRHLAEVAVDNIDALLWEAEIAAYQASHLLSDECNATTRHALDRVVLDSAHLRIISLIHDDLLYCSSFSISQVRIVDLSSFENGALSLRPGSIVSPNKPILILLAKFSNGAVTSSIDGVHLVSILERYSIHHPLTLNVGESNLLKNGVVIVDNIAKSELSLKSQNFPFNISYDDNITIPFFNLIRSGSDLIVGSILIGMISVVLIWHYLLPIEDLVRHLKCAIERHEIEPWYQPIICTKTGRIYGVEVLARWRHRSGEIIPPNKFISQAEASGLIIPITQQLTMQVAKNFSMISSRLSTKFHIGFNLSAIHVREHEETTRQFKNFQDNFLNSEIQTVLEITEREPADGDEYLSVFIENLKKSNILIAIDDFGTGYSNFNYLYEVPIDYIKIDKSFTAGLVEGSESDVLTVCVINMAKRLGMNIIAEGVESEYQVSWYVEHGVTLLQGYYFSRPVQFPELVKMIILQEL